ncbi:MAG: hypothetical protein ACK5LL_10980 [Suipraeoptans sp.]
MNKRIYIFALILCLVFSFTGCKENNGIEEAAEKITPTPNIEISATVNIKADLASEL